MAAAYMTDPLQRETGTNRRLPTSVIFLVARLAGMYRAGLDTHRIVRRSHARDVYRPSSAC